MTRKILAVTGTRADYGLMTPIFKKILQNEELELELIVTGMHLLPEFKSGLETIVRDGIGKLHYVSMILGEDSGKAMAQALGLAIYGMASVMETVKPEIVLLQGDRGEMLAAAIAAVHLNIAVVHMSGGDFSGSIDDSVRNAISKLAHIHLTTCGQSTKRLLDMGEAAERIYEVGEPVLDLIATMDFIPADELAREFSLDLDRPLVLATQHPVTTESDQAAWQITQTLEALEELHLQTVFTYPNTDTGGREMVKVLQSYRDREFIRVIPNLGSAKYLSMMRMATLLVGNSSSGIIEAPSFKLPVVNIGTRQYGRMRACNVIDTGYTKEEIKKAICFALEDRYFRETLMRECKNPYGDGMAAQHTVELLAGLTLDSRLINKWHQ